MNTPEIIQIYFDKQNMTYEDACEIALQVMAIDPLCQFGLCCKTITQVSTAALARLILLRATLQRQGGNLWLNGLGGQAQNLYEVHQMQQLLPQNIEFFAC